MRPHFSLGKNNLTLAALKIGEVLLNSQAALQFERAITLLDFPMARLKWWWKEIELVEHKEGLPPDSKKLSMLLNEMLEDVANPDEANLGPINATFAKLAKPILVEITRSRSINPNTSAISKLLQDAVFEIEKRWKKGGNEVFESASTLPLGRFSLFFSSFEQRSYGNVKEQFMANLEIPGQYDSLSQAPDPIWHAKIVSFETNATIFTQSKQKPKKITLRGSDGREYAFIAKGSEDLRQDERIQRLYRAMDSLLTQSPSARAKALRIRTFHVLPLTRRSGLIEFVHGTEPVGRILLNSSDDAKKNIGNVSARHEAFIKARGMFGLSGKKRKEIDGDALIQEDKMGVMCDLTKVPRPAHDDYLTAMANAELNASKKVLRGLGHPGHSPAKDAIRQKLQVASGCPEAFLAARRVFAASLAASSISGWIVGLGDRHCENILLDVAHGSLIHVDFGYAFGTGTSTLPIPEIVPFRATRTFLGALEPLDAKEWLEADMARVLTALQSGKNLLEGAMDIFIRDPILDWTRETQKGDDVEKHVEMRVMHARSKLSLANPAFICIEQCKPKHGQSAHWEGLQRLIIGDDDGVRAQAGETCKDVDEQVECLMDMATDPRILANSWTGWKSWL
jgi:DNA-dependent protein kinase catalytic subunit